MRAFSRIGLAAAALLFWLASPISSALAQSAAGAFPPYSAKSIVEESLRLPHTQGAASVGLAPLDPSAVAAVVAANGKSLTKRLQIGIGRDVPDPIAASSAALRWSEVEGGVAAQWQVASPGAAALRIALEGILPGPGIELRFSGQDQPEVVYGPFALSELQASGNWSPVLEGESAIVEVFAPTREAALALDLRIAQVSHLFVSPANPFADQIAKASQACEVDLICRSAGDSALANAGRSVARMTFSDGQSAGTFLCTGTLLNTTNNSFIPYFYSAHHCINTQAAANTLTTHWFYDRTGCGSGVLNPNTVQLPGGATLLYSSAFYDALFLRLNGTPPNGAFFSGWDAASLSGGTALTAIHHPAGDVKKVSLGTMGGFGAPSGSGTNFIIANWNSIATGVTEGGSSGSGIFTLQGSEYRLRGGLYGGPSSCTAPSGSLHDYYSRFDQVYSSISQYLSPAASTCTYSLSPTSVTVGSGATSGSVTVTTTAGCAWTASSDSSWLTTSSSGNGSGTATYSIAANPQGTSRVGTLTVAGRPFTVTQQAPLTTGTNLVANPGFETGTASWSQSASGGFPIIFQNTAQQTVARSGSWYAWLGGYDNAIDTLYQDITIPAGSGARLQFWYFITTNESTSTAFDSMVVAVANPLTGARLSTLATFSNVNATGGWVQSNALDLSAFAGQTVRLMFVAQTDGSLVTNFFLDDISVTATTASGGTNHTALWWNPNESGWGVNFNHQGDIVFGTLFTYDASGNPMWLVMASGNRQSGETYSGTLYRTTGPAFNANPFTPIGAANLTTVGTMTVTFSGNSASLAYSVNGVAVNKSIQKQVFGSRAASCQPSSADRSSLTNYQDLWWNAAESGWGVNVAHQDNTLFATLFTYNAAGQGLWLVMPAGARQPDGSYSGDLYQTTGPAFNAQPFTPIGSQNLRRVGTMQFRFASGIAGTLTYSVDGVTVVKAITRQVFSNPLPACAS